VSIAHWPSKFNVSHWRLKSAIDKNSAIPLLTRITIFLSKFIFDYLENCEIKFLASLPKILLSMTRQAEVPELSIGKATSK